MTIDESIFENLPGNAIFLSPGVNGSTLVGDHRKLLSTFRFCDTESVLFVNPGEEYKFFGLGGQGKSVF